MNTLKCLLRKRFQRYWFRLFFNNDMFFLNGISFHRRMLHMFKHIFVQDESSLQLLQSIHIHNASIAGDTRFDRVTHVASSVIDLPIVEKFCANRNVIVAGSTWPTKQCLYKLLNILPLLHGLLLRMNCIHLTYKIYKHNYRIVFCILQYPIINY